MKSRRRGKKNRDLFRQRDRGSFRPRRHIRSKRVVRSNRAAALFGRTVDRLLPVNARVLVLSGGDEDVIRFKRCRGAHFPQDMSGEHARYSLPGSSAAIAHLEALRFRGAEYLVVPAAAGPWFDLYPEFKRHLERRYAPIDSTPDDLTIFALRSSSRWRELDELINDLRSNLTHEPALLNWDCDCAFGDLFPDCRSFQSPIKNPDTLPYASGSIDVVALPAAQPERLSEARRVASEALVAVSADNTGAGQALSIERLRSKSGGAGHEPAFVSIMIWQSPRDLPVEQRLAFLRETIPSESRYEILVRYVSKRSTSAQRREGSRVSRSTRQPHQDDLIVFLGSRTLPLPGWFPWLRSAFTTHPDAGVVGGGLINFDGTGSIGIFGAEAADPGAAGSSCLRKIDMCASSFFATRRSLFDAAGQRFVDPTQDAGALAHYCAAVRDRGYAVYLEPDCNAIFFGKYDTRDGNGQYAQINSSARL